MPTFQIELSDDEAEQVRQYPLPLPPEETPEDLAGRTLAIIREALAIRDTSRWAKGDFTDAEKQQNAIDDALPF